MKRNLQNFIDGLIMYDYILFGGVLLLFVFFIVLAILLRKKTILAVFLILLAFATFLLGPTAGYFAMHKFLFKNQTELLSYKKLHFTPAVVIEAKIINQSKFDFQSCKITASAYQVTSNKYKNYIYKFKPFKKMSIFEYGITKGQTREFKMIVEPFTYGKDFNISLGADCK